MNALWNSPAGLLLVTGALLGLAFPLGKIGSIAGVPALAWSFLVSAGVAIVLMAVQAVRRQPPQLDAHRLRFHAVAGAISYAMPNLIMFASIPRLGAGYTAIMLTLSPVVTLALSLVVGLRRPSALGLAGIAAGFVGAVIVAATRGELGRPADLGAVALGLLIPLFLASGNIYRTLDWPRDAGPIELALGSHAASALILAALALLPGMELDLATLGGAPLAAAGQVAASAAMFVFFFRLQSVGGPVYLSQIGYVAAAVGLVSATLLLGERYSLVTWSGAAVIGAGIVMTTRAQLRQ